MFRMWIRQVKKTRTVKDMIFESADDINRTKKVYMGLEKACEDWSLSKPIWLELNKKDFIKFSKTRFTKDNFIEEIEFDYLEIRMIEED